MIQCWMIQHMLSEGGAFNQLQESAVFMALKGERPQRPPNTDKTNVRDDVWNIIQKCWEGQAIMRPPIQNVAMDLNRICSTERPLRLLSIGENQL